ncbi:hypothetical protein HDE_04125 [Halotydeus destructor]|nr:hypothetical protein HDE_04125 [Halotydeus destructor]
MKLKCILVLNVLNLLMIHAVSQLGEESQKMDYYEDYGQEDQSENNTSYDEAGFSEYDYTQQVAPAEDEVTKSEPLTMHPLPEDNNYYIESKTTVVSGQQLQEEGIPDEQLHDEDQEVYQPIDQYAYREEDKYWTQYDTRTSDEKDDAHPVVSKYSSVHSSGSDQYEKHTRHVFTESGPKTYIVYHKVAKSYD